MSKEIKAVPAIIKRDAGHVNTAGERVMAVTFYLPAGSLEDFLGVGQRECTITIPEAEPPAPRLIAGPEVHISPQSRLREDIRATRTGTGMWD